MKLKTVWSRVLDLIHRDRSEHATSITTPPKHDPVNDPVNHPSHYTTHPSGVEVIEIVEGQGFCLGNAWKYLARHRSKGKPVEDLAKARWYLQRELICQRRIEINPQADPVLEAKRRYMASEPDLRLLKLYGLIWSAEEAGTSSTACDVLVEAITLIDDLIDETRKERSDVPGNG